MCTLWAVYFGGVLASGGDCIRFGLEVGRLDEFTALENSTTIPKAMDYTEAISNLFQFI